MLLKWVIKLISFIGASLCTFFLFRAINLDLGILTSSYFLVSRALLMSIMLPIGSPLTLYPCCYSVFLNKLSLVYPNLRLPFSARIDIGQHCTKYILI